MSPTAKLAMFGGERAVPRTRSQVEWPVVTDDDRAAMLRALDSGVLVSNAEGESEVVGLEREFAELTGVNHCSGVANGTVAITLALAALGIGAGDEVLVPALTFIGTPLGVVHSLATPVFVDVDPVTFNMDPASAAAAISPRTRAIVVVHLHGLPAEMAALRELADRHGLALVEDAAQAHGATYEGKAAGSLGDLGCFSLNATKNLPTCGEGGLVTTNDPELSRGVAMRRQFGEAIDERPRSYTAHVARLEREAQPGPGRLHAEPAAAAAATTTGAARKTCGALLERLERASRNHRPQLSARSDARLPHPALPSRSRRRRPRGHRPRRVPSGAAPRCCAPRASRSRATS